MDMYVKPMLFLEASCHSRDTMIIKNPMSPLILDERDDRTAPFYFGNLVIVSTRILFAVHLPTQLEPHGYIKGNVAIDMKDLIEKRDSLAREHVCR